MELLLAHGVNLEARSKKSSGTALHWAAKAANEKGLRLLLSRGADAEARTDRQQESTALHFAAANGFAECVRALLEGGADHSATDEV